MRFQLWHATTAEQVKDDPDVSKHLNKKLSDCADKTQILLLAKGKEPNDAIQIIPAGQGDIPLT